MPDQMPSEPPQGPGGPRRGEPGAPPPPRRSTIILIALGIIATLFLLTLSSHQTTTTQLDYTQFVNDVKAGKVTSASIDPSGAVTGTLKSGEQYTTQLPTALGEGNLLSEMQSEHVAITATGAGTSWAAILEVLLPFVLLGVLFWYLMRRAGTAMGAASGIGRANPKVVDLEHPTTTFADVAGYDGVKREVGEIIDFLKTPERFRRAGATGPRGVVMLGPPGTGKTLLARAIAGEASVPFLSVTGSSFVEMFVGVGAARVRSLFEQARKQAPAIVFIDEIDAIGQRRGGHMVSNDEREQTLDQLLAEMDGFDPAEGVVVLAATNRPEILDPALLRPGRFDRQVVVPLPTRNDRLAILKVHCKDKHLDDTVDLDAVARGTPGFSGADLANLTNEAAICAVRADREIISALDFDEARDRVLLGLRDRSGTLMPEERHAVATHELGHAMVAALLPDADPVAKVSILPAGQTLGVTEQLPIDERHLYSERHLRAILAVQLGGRAAELVVLGEASTGAADDLSHATQVATKMVREYGLSPELGPISYSSGAPMYLGEQEVQTRSYSEATQRIMDEEVARLLREAEKTATDLLKGHRHELEKLTDVLVENETIDGAVVYEAVKHEKPSLRAVDDIA